MTEPTKTGSVRSYLHWPERAERQRLIIGIGALLAYVATIFAANWAIATFGVVPVGLGLLAPAGVYFAGLAFTLRDGVQEGLGRRWTVVAILAGAALSALVSPRFALASAVAFLCSEGIDFAVYTWLKPRGWFGAVTASNVAGLVVDSILFLTLAFGSLTFLTGQIVGKFWMTALAVVLLAAWRKRALLLGYARG